MPNGESQIPGQEELFGKSEFKTVDRQPAEEIRDEDYLSPRDMAEALEDIGYDPKVFVNTPDGIKQVRPAFNGNHYPESPTKQIDELEIQAEKKIPASEVYIPYDLFAGNIQDFFNEYTGYTDRMSAAAERIAAAFRGHKLRVLTEHPELQEIFEKFETQRHEDLKI